MRKRTIVRPDVKVLHTPVPKAGCTSMFGYPPVAAPADPVGELARWEQAVEPMLPLVRELIRRHERIGQLARAVEAGQPRRKRANP